QQRAGDAGKSGRQRIDRDQPPLYRNADSGCAQRIAFDGEQRKPERRIDDATREQETDEKDNQAVDVAVMAVEIEAEAAENRCDIDTLQAVGPASDVGIAVGD